MEISGRCRAPTEHGVERRVQLFFYLRILGQQIPGPGEVQGGGLVSGEEQRDHLIAKLLVANGIAVIFAGRQQQSVQVFCATRFLSDSLATLYLCAPASSLVRDDFV